MKRQFLMLKDDSKQSTSTPHSELPRKAKRGRRSPHSNLYDSPVLGLQQVLQVCRCMSQKLKPGLFNIRVLPQPLYKDSPESEYRHVPRLSGTAQKKFENFSLNTPVAGLAKASHPCLLAGAQKCLPLERLWI